MYNTKNWYSGFANLNNVRIHYVRKASDEKTPLVMAHGFTDNWACIAPIAEELTNIFDVVLYDARGHGLTDAPQSGYDADTMATDLVSLCNELELNEPVVFGHSLGANTAARAANLGISPRALILEDPAGQKVNNAPPTRTEQKREMLRQWRLASHKDLRDEYTDTLRFSEQLATARKQLRPEIINIDERGYSYLDEIFSTSAPTLVIRPDSNVVDYLEPERDASLETNYPNVSVRNIPETGHTIFRDNFKETLETVMDFLDRVFE